MTGKAANGHFDTHVCLVSQQATPNLTPVLDPELGPARLVMLVTPDMSQRAQWLESELRSRTHVKVERIEVLDAWDMHGVLEQLIQWIDQQAPDASIALNVTGGTKPMAMAAQQAFAMAGLAVFYVHPTRDEVQWLEPRLPAFTLNNRLKLEDYLAAHGWSVRQRPPRRRPPAHLNALTLEPRKPGRCPLLPPMRRGLLQRPTRRRHRTGPGCPADRHRTLAFPGPNADRYLEAFKKFTGPSGPQFALTWHWPAFVFEPFLWFLYRKMYVYALIYAIGPAMAFYITQDLSADLIWRIIAGASANHIYFWHAKEQLAKIKRERGTGGESRQQMLGELGGVQPYVVWVGVGLLVLKIGLVVAMFKDGPPDGSKGTPAKPHPASLTHV